MTKPEICEGCPELERRLAVVSEYEAKIDDCNKRAEALQQVIDSISTVKIALGRRAVLKSRHTDILVERGVNRIRQMGAQDRANEISACKGVYTRELEVPESGFSITELACGLLTESFSRQAIPYPKD